MVETSDDRNGVVVNRAISAPEICDRLNKRPTETVGRAEVQLTASLEIRAKCECFTALNVSALQRYDR